MNVIRVRTSILGLALLAGFSAPSTGAAADTTLSPTVEEQRLDKAVPQEILERSGFDTVAPEFTRALEGARSYAQARRVVVDEGTALWRRAVARAQGRGIPVGI